MSHNAVIRGWYPAFSMLLSFAMSAGAHVGDRVYPIGYLSDEMLERIDLNNGSVEAWQELIGEPAMTLLDFAESFGNSEPDPSDLDFRIWLAWHDDPPRLYAAVVASDDVYNNTHDYDAGTFSGQNMNVHDSITLVIDGDHGGGLGCDMDCSWVEGEEPVISVIELYVTPFDRLVYDDIDGSVASDLTAGKVIGFGIVVHDNDEPDDGGAWVPEAMIPGSPPALFRVYQVKADDFSTVSFFLAKPWGRKTRPYSQFHGDESRLL